MYKSMLIQEKKKKPLVFFPLAMEARMIAGRINPQSKQYSCISCFPSKNRNLSNFRPLWWAMKVHRYKHDNTRLHPYSSKSLWILATNMLPSKSHLLLPCPSCPCPHDSFWVPATWPHTQPSDRHLQQILKIELRSLPVRRNPSTRYCCKNNTDCCVFCCRGSKTFA